jgi:hypothetical protein
VNLSSHATRPVISASGSATCSAGVGAGESFSKRTLWLQGMEDGRLAAQHHTPEGMAMAGLAPGATEFLARRRSPEKRS